MKAPPLAFLAALAACAPAPDTVAVTNGTGVTTTETCAVATFWEDGDADGFGEAAVAVEACAAPVGFVANDDDCNDDAAGVFPGAIEWCDGFDQDCDEAPDDDAVDVVRYYADDDHDGFGRDDETIWDCAPGEGWALEAGDCDDANPDVHPEALEIPYDGVDQDCDRVSDADADRDGVDAEHLGGLDCDDADPDIHPGAYEACDEVDQDCDGAPWDEGTASFVGDNGAVVDLTTVFDTAPSFSVPSWDVVDPGTVSLCGGHWYGRLEITASDVVLRGLGASQAMESDLYEPVVVWSGASRLEVLDLTLITGGYGNVIEANGPGELLVERAELAAPDQDSADDGIDLNGGALTVRDTWIHDLAVGVDVRAASTVIIEDLAADHLDYEILCVSSGATVTAARVYGDDAGDIATVEDADVSLVDSAFENSGTLTLLGPGSLALERVDIVSGDLRVVAPDALTIEEVTVTGSPLCGATFTDVVGPMTVGPLSIVGASTCGVAFESVTDLTLEGLSVEASLAIGLDVLDSTVTVVDGMIVGNSGDQLGGGIVAEASDLTLTDTLVADNFADQGPAAWLIDSTLRCVATGAGAGAIVRNVSPLLTTGAVEANAPWAVVTSDGCDWGEGADDNTPVDLALDDAPDASYGADAHFTCTDALGCY